LFTRRQSGSIHFLCANDVRVSLFCSADFSAGLAFSACQVSRFVSHIALSSNPVMKHTESKIGGRGPEMDLKGVFVERFCPGVGSRTICLRTPAMPKAVSDAQLE
jgi:hypothetical protein